MARLLKLIVRYWPLRRPSAGRIASSLCGAGGSSKAGPTTSCSHWMANTPPFIACSSQMRATRSLRGRARGGCNTVRALFCRFPPGRTAKICRFARRATFPTDFIGRNFHFDRISIRCCRRKSTCRTRVATFGQKFADRCHSARQKMHECVLGKRGIGISWSKRR